jgi:hypothetical protein
MIDGMKVGFPVLAVLIFVGLTSINWTPEDAGIRLSDPAVANMHGTVVTPVPDRAIPRGRNVLWCATFQMAWDKAASHLGRPLRMKPGSALVDSLNANPFDRRWLDEESVSTVGGYADEELYKQIDQNVRAKTGRKSKLLDRIRSESQPGDLVFHALLVKNLEFETPFAKLGIWKIGKRKVAWFGFTPSQEKTVALRRQVRVHHYTSKDDFVIELLNRNPEDHLLLTKLPKTPATSSELANHTLHRISPNSPEAGASDLLGVPHIVAEESVEFSELHGKTVVGKPHFVRAALQTIDFRMDEKGVKLKSEASLSFGCSAAPQIDPRLMILDPPFGIVMVRKGSPKPYFTAWIANADLLDE